MRTSAAPASDRAAARAAQAQAQLPAALDRQSHDLLGRVAIGAGALLQRRAEPPPVGAQQRRRRRGGIGRPAADANTLRNQTSASRPAPVLRARLRR